MPRTPSSVCMTTCRKTTPAIRICRGASPVPATIISMGSSVSFGTWYSAAISGSRERRTVSKRPITTPHTTPAAAPTRNPAMARNKVIRICGSRSPLRTISTAVARSREGGGKNSGSSQPRAAASSHAASRVTGTHTCSSQGERGRTAFRDGAGSAESSGTDQLGMFNLRARRVGGSAVSAQQPHRVHFSIPRRDRLGDDGFHSRRVNPFARGHRATPAWTHDFEKDLPDASRIGEAGARTRIQSQLGLAGGRFTFDQLIIPRAAAQPRRQQLFDHIGQVRRVEGGPLRSSLAEGADPTDGARKSQPRIDAITGGGFEHAVIVHLDVDK